MKKIILMVETGSDVTPEFAVKYDVYVVPMHVTFDNETFDDGSFTVEKICDYYKETGNLPKTSGSTPKDFERAFDEVHKKWPEAHILYLAYSAVTTCSYQSAVIASEGRDYITMLDTKQVSIGQGAIVAAMGRFLKMHPDISIDQAVEEADKLCVRVKMCFMPDNLEFLRAGGRVSNAAFLGSRILRIHPCIEIIDGKLVATKKYRGKMTKTAAQMVRDYADVYHLDRTCLWLVHTVGFSNEAKTCVENTVRECGFHKWQWIQANGVITVHGGPGAFGMAGFSKK